MVSTAAIAVEHDPLAYKLTASAGDSAWVLPASKLAWQLPQPKSGVWLVPKPAVLPFPPALVFNAAETQTYTVQVPGVAPSSWNGVAASLFAQGHTLKGPSQGTLGSPTHTLVLALAAGPDCDGVSDYVDIHRNPGLDQNGNLVPDSCDP